MNEKSREGKRDEKNGGIITDLRTLPIGTKFYVHNGSWYGVKTSDKILTILRKNEQLSVHISDSDPYLSISIIEQKEKVMEICLNCYHGEVCSADNKVMAKIKGCCNSFENKSEVLKLPYTVGKSIIKYEDNEVIITSK